MTDDRLRPIWLPRDLSNEVVMFLRALFHRAGHELPIADELLDISSKSPFLWACALRRAISVCLLLTVGVALFWNEAGQAQSLIGGSVNVLNGVYPQAYSVVTDAAGNVYYVDNSSSTLVKAVPPSGTTQFWGVTQFVGGFSGAQGIAMDASGNIFVADTGNNEVKEVLAASGYSTVNVLAGGAVFKAPAALAVDAGGNVFVADTGNNAIKEISVSSSYANVAQVASSVSFQQPAGVAIDASGNLYVSNTGSNTVLQLTVANSYSSAIPLGSGWKAPMGLALDSSANLYVVDSGNSRAVEVLSAGGYTTQTPVTQETFYQPTGIGLDVYGDLFVAEPQADEIFEIAPQTTQFPATALLGASITRTVSFTGNVNGNYPTVGSVQALTVGASSSSQFSIVNGSNNCSSVGYQASCSVRVTFTPTTPGVVRGAVVAYDQYGNLLGTAYVVGTGTGPQVTFPSNGSRLQIASGAFLDPEDVVFDGSGNLIVADGGHQVVERYNPNTSSLSTIGPFGLTLPYSVALDGAGNLFISDNGASLVYKSLAPNYTQTVTLGSGFSGPKGIAVDGAGNLFITDTGNHAIKELTAASGYQTTLTLGGGFSFPEPTDVAVDSKGNLYVADRTAGAVYKLPASCGYCSVQSFVSGFDNPRGVMVDASDSLYVSDTDNGNIYEIANVGGAYPTKVALDSGLNYPAGLATDSNGNLWAAESGNNTNWISELPLAQPAALAFNTTAQYETSSDSPRPVLLANRGNAPLIFSTPGSNSNPSISTSFTYSAPGESGCPILSTSSTPVPLAASAQCELDVSFTPQSVGPITGQLTFSNNDLNQPTGGAGTQSVTLTGTGLPVPQISSVSPSSGPVTGGTTVTLSGTNFSGVTSISFGGYAAQSFTVNSSTMITAVTPSLPAAQTVDVILSTSQLSSNATANDRYTFNKLSQTIQISGFIGSESYGTGPYPITVSATSGLPVTLTILSGPGQITYDSNNNPSLVLTGVGTIELQESQAGNGIWAPVTGEDEVVVSSAPYGYQFTSENIGVTSPSVVVSLTFISSATLKSTSAAAVQVYSEGVLNTGEFQVVSDSGDPRVCVFGAQYGAGQNCDLAVTFTPKAGGDRAGAVALIGSDGSEVAEVVLYGTGNGPVAVFPNPAVQSFSSAGARSAVENGNGDIFVADASNGAIYQYTASSSYASWNTISGFIAPASLWIDAEGNLYVADKTASSSGYLMYEIFAPGYTQKIQVLTSFGSLTLSPYIALDDAGLTYFATGSDWYEAQAGSNYVSYTTLPGAVHGVSVDDQGSVAYTYAGSNGQDLVSILSRAKGVTITPSTSLNNAYGVAVDREQNLYTLSTDTTSASHNNVLRKYLAPNYTTVQVLDSYASTGTGDYFSLSVATNNDLLIADSGNGVVRRVIQTQGAYTFNNATPTLTSPDSPYALPVMNQGDAPLTFSGSPSLNETTDFALNSTGTTCSNGASIQPGATCAVSVTFQPQQVGSYSGTVTLGSNNFGALSTTVAGVSTKGTATVTINSQQPYTGSPVTPTATTSPAGLNVTFTWNGSSIMPTAVGTYTIVGTINDYRYTGSGTGTLTIVPGTASCQMNSASLVWNGNAQSLPVSTTPAGLNTTVTYNTFLGGAPIEPGTYTQYCAVNDPNWTSPTNSATLTIIRATPTITIAPTVVYTGFEISAPVTVTPSSETGSLSVVYDSGFSGPSAGPTNLGTYTVTATISDTHYYGTVTGQFSIVQIPTTITIQPTVVVYNGNQQGANITVSPSTPIAVTYNGSSTAPTNVGTYSVAATTTDPYHTGSATGTLTITQAPANLSITSITVPYDGNAHPASFTNPHNVSYTLTYNGSPNPPVTAGTYNVSAQVTDPNWTGSASGTVTITKVSAQLSVSDQSVVYNGEPQSITTVTSSPSIPLQITYNGSTNAPTQTGVYAVVVSAADTTDYTAAPVTATFTILAQQAAPPPVSPLGVTTDAVSATIYFTGQVTLNSTRSTAVQVLTTGLPNFDFKDAGTGTCTPGATYQASSSCTVNFTFTPSAAGNRHGVVQLWDNSGTPVVAATAYISGIGKGSLVTFPTSSTATTLPTSGSIGPAVTDAAGNLYYVNTSNQTLNEYVAATGQIRQLASGVQAYPWNMAIDGAGNIFAGNISGVEEFVAANNYAMTTISSSSLSSPAGLVLDSKGNVFVTDFAYQNVQEFSPINGYSSSTVISSGYGEAFNLAMDGNDNLFVQDAAAGTIYELTAASSYTTKTAVIQQGFAWGITTDPAGNIYANAGNSVNMYTAADGYSTSQQIVAAPSGSGVEDITADASGHLYVVNGSAIVRVDLTAAPTLSSFTAAVGTVSSPQSVPVLNSGTDNLTFASIAPSSAVFPLDSSTNCFTSTPLASGSLCTIAADFAPTVAGSASGELDLTDNDLNVTGSLQTVNLTGTGSVSAPTVTAVSPANGPPGGGTAVTIMGTNFYSVTAVKFGSTTAATYTVNSGTQITAVSPAGSFPSTVDITVTNAGGTSTTSSADTFSYVTASTLSWSPSSSTGFKGVPIGTGVLDATTNSTTPITYTATNSSNVTSSITSTSTLTPGTYTLTASVAANSNYTANSVTTPFTVINQEIFLTNSGGNVTSVYDNGGPASGAATGGGIGAAVDANGYVWSINTNGNGVSQFTDAGVFSVSHSGIASATALAIDGNDNVWITNGNGTLSVLSNSGTVVSTIAGSTTAAPSSIAIDISGNVWVSNPSTNTIDEVIGGAAPVAPLSTAVTAATSGARP